MQEEEKQAEKGVVQQQVASLQAVIAEKQAKLNALQTTQMHAQVQFSELYVFSLH